jgi:hypothetical protein
MRTIDNSIHTKLVFQFQPHILKQRELTIYTNNLSHRTVRKVHKWMAQKVDLIQIPSDNVVALVAHI